MAPLALAAQENPNYDPDIDADGCYSVADILGLLPLFGTCEEPTNTTSCVDSVAMDNYWYDAVLIGEQCWFAENLRTEHYANGDPIPAGLDQWEWSIADYGACSYYAETEDWCNSFSASDFSGLPCDNAQQALEHYGRLYNWHAVDDTRKLCPSGWHVPSASECAELIGHLNAAYPLHSSLVVRQHGSWGNPVTGLDLFGFKLLPAGFRSYSPPGYYPVYQACGRIGTWFWTSDDSDNEGRAITFESFTYNENNGVTWQQLHVGVTNQHEFGFSVRCIKD